MSPPGRPRREASGYSESNKESAAKRAKGRTLGDRYAGRVDLLLAEGYSFESYPKILVAGAKTLAEERIAKISDIIAVVVSSAFECGSIVKFDFSAIDRLADLLEHAYLSPEQFERREMLSFSEAFSQ